MNIPPVAFSSVAAALALLPAQMTSPPALVMLYAIGLQESRFRDRRQQGNGPARGFWQFERGGGVVGVHTHAASRYWAASVCMARDVPFKVASIYPALEHDDILAAACARLLLFTDPKKLPALGDEKGAWALYLRTWRPGKPHPKTWPECYALALDAVAEVAL